MRTTLALSLLCALCLASPAPAQDQAAAPPPCSGPDHRAFDFWVGTWEVTTVSDGKPAGTNTISKVLNGCVLHENWAGTPNADGSQFVGQSFNAFDGQTGQWHQTWVDGSGGVLKLDGGLDGAVMVLEGPRKAADGTDQRHRITWTPHDDGTVRQTWTMTTDDGRSWTTLFDGLYRRKDGS